MDRRAVQPDEQYHGWAQRLARDKRQRLSLLRQLGPSDQGPTLVVASARLQRDLVGRLHDSELIAIFGHLDPDKTAKLLRHLDAKRARILTQTLSDNTREKVEFLLKFNPRAAAGLMNLDYIEVSRNATFAKIAENLKDHEKATGKFPAILVVNGNELVGELPGHELALRKPSQRIESYITKAITLPYDSPEHVVVQTFLKHPHKKIVVEDADRAILGIINTDDIIQLVGSHSTGSLYNFAGVHHEEDTNDSALTKVKYRYKWLIINLGTAFLAASVVGLFEDTISRFVLLAIYMPIVAGMGGNAGTQSMAVAVRGLALNQIDLHTARKNIINEMMAGAMNGVINGLIVAAVAVFFNQSPGLGFVIGVAMVVNLIIAGFFGSLIPMIMKALKKDPASSATIFITTATDVFGFFVFLGLASIIL